MRVLVLALLVSLVAVAPAAAQPVGAPPPVPTAAAPAAHVQPLARVATPRSGTGEAVLFWIFAVITIGGGLATITRRNAVSAVMFLVGTFMGLSALYALLYAHFLAVIQVLVYAGAIMVLFVFVVMILNKEEEEPWALRGIVGKLLGGAALIYLVVRLVQVLWAAPARIPEPATMPAGYGTTQAVAETLFSSYLFPFEAVSLVLLIAVVGALVLAHPAHPNVGEAELR